MITKIDWKQILHTEHNFLNKNKNYKQEKIHIKFHGSNFPRGQFSWGQFSGGNSPGKTFPGG